MSQAAITIEDCKKFLVAELKDQLKSRNASTIGKKAELLERLLELVKLELCSPPTIVVAPIQENTPEITEKGDELPKSSIEVDSTIEMQDNGVETSEEQGSILEISIESNMATEPEEVKPSDSETLVLEVEKNISVDVATVNEAVPSIEPPTNEDIPEVVPDVVKESSLNEIIKTNLKKKIALSIQEDPIKGDASNRFVRIDNFQRPLHLKLLLKWFEETLGLSGISEENVWLNGIKSHCYVDLPSIEQAEICIARATGLKFPATSSKSLVASFTRVSAKDAPTSAEAQRKPEDWKAFREESAVQTHSSSTPAATVGVKRKIEDVGGQMLKKAVEMATTGAAKSPRLITPSAGSGGGATGSFGEDAAATGFLTRKHKLELGLLVASDDENANANATESPRAMRPPQLLPPQPPVLSLDDLFKKTKTVPCIYWLPAPLEKRLKTKASIRSREVQGRLG